VPPYPSPGTTPISPGPISPALPFVPPITFFLCHPLPWASGWGGRAPFAYRSNPSFFRHNSPQLGETALPCFLPPLSAERAGTVGFGAAVLYFFALLFLITMTLLFFFLLFGAFFSFPCTPFLSALQRPRTLLPSFSYPVLPTPGSFFLLVVLFLRSWEELGEFFPPASRVFFSSFLSVNPFPVAPQLRTSDATTPPSSLFRDL